MVRRLPIERGAIDLDAGRAWIAKGPQTIVAAADAGGRRCSPPTSAGTMATVSGLRGAKLAREAGSGRADAGWA